MADEADNTQTAEAAAADQDPIKQIKSEFGRKFDNLNAELKAQNEMVQAALANLVANNQPPQQSAPRKPVSQLIFEDTDAAVAQITKQVTDQVTGSLSRTQGVANVISEFTSKYPEFAKDDSEATKLTLKKSKSLPHSLQGTPEGARMAMLEAVAELGLVAASKRSTRVDQNDDFSLSGSNSAPRAPKTKEPELDPKSLALGELLGVDYKKDPKRMENLKKAAARTNWNRYKGKGD